MTIWVKFFRVLIRHVPGYSANLPYEAAVDHPNPSCVAKRLHMVPLPKGHHIGLTMQAEEWIETEATA